MRVNVTNVEYLAASQFDVFYNRTMLSLRTPYPPGGGIVDTLDRTIHGDPPEGCGNQSIATFLYSNVDIGYGAGNDSGCVRVLFVDTWSQTETDHEGGCSGGNSSGQCGDGWITVLTFRTKTPGTGQLGFWQGNITHKTQINQVIYNASNVPDYQPFINYSYTGLEHLKWGGNVTVTVTP